MSLLLAMTGWHVEDWRARFQALLPDMPIVVLGVAILTGGFFGAHGVASG